MALTMPEGRQDHDARPRVAEEPEDVLVHHRVATAGGVEEAGAEVAVGQVMEMAPANTGITAISR